MRETLVALFVVVMAAISTLARPEAVIGRDFADVYAAFAPIEALYRSFADHLFSGTEIAVPGALPAACETFLSSLETLHEDLVVQSAAEAAALGELVRLRVAGEGFCSGFASDLAALSAQSGVPADLEDRLVAEGLFAQIRELNSQFENALDAALESTASEEARWTMAVTFAVRVLLVTSEWVRVAPDTAVIFYGQPEADTPPFAVPETARGAMATIVALAGKDLSQDEIEVVRASALVIYEYLIDS